VPIHRTSLFLSDGWVGMNLGARTHLSTTYEPVFFRMPSRHPASGHGKNLGSGQFGFPQGCFQPIISATDFEARKSAFSAGREASQNLPFSDYLVEEFTSRTFFDCRLYTASGSGRVVFPPSCQA